MMCGIAGFIGYGDEFDLDNMLDRIFHRGPDERGKVYFHEFKGGLGIQRLSIVDIESGKQPISNETKSVFLVMNGEIYNANELRKELQAKNHRFSTHHSDTEVLVHGYEQWGIDVVKRLNGMFAFALIDLNRKILILGRDRFGQKPLFYMPVRGYIVFGSEIKTILAHPLSKKEPDLRALYYYFSLKHIPSPLTAFKGIYALKPGHLLIYNLTDGEIDIKKYWDLSQELFSKNPKLKTDDLISLLEDAVKIRLMSDVPIGVYLSGGLDSSLISYFVVKNSTRPIKAFTLFYDPPVPFKQIDLEYAMLMADYLKIENHEIYYMSERELIDDMSRILHHFDQPFAGTISTFFLTKLARKHVKVVLSGDGADELFGSYKTHRVAISIYKRCIEKAKVEENSEFDERFLDEICKKTKGVLWKWRSLFHPFNTDEKRYLLMEDFFKILPSTEPIEIYWRDHEKNLFYKFKEDPINAVLELEYKTIFPDQVLSFMDILSMAHSVELRSPFLDYRFVLSAFKIPGWEKIKDGEVKIPLKKLASEFLPPEIVSRKKEGFVIPNFYWMRKEPLKSFVISYLKNSSLVENSMLNQKYITMLYRGLESNPSNEILDKIWTIFNYLIWWEENFL